MSPYFSKCSLPAWRGGSERESRHGFPFIFFSPWQPGGKHVPRGLLLPVPWPVPSYARACLTYISNSLIIRRRRKHHGSEEAQGDDGPVASQILRQVPYQRAYAAGMGTGEVPPAAGACLFAGARDHGNRL